MKSTTQHSTEAVIEHDIRLTYGRRITFLYAYDGFESSIVHYSLSQLLENRRWNLFEYIFFYFPSYSQQWQYVLSKSAFITAGFY